MSIPGYNVHQLALKDPSQMDLYRILDQGSRQGTQAGLANLSGMAGGSDEYFQGLEAPARREFQRGIGDIASRFSGLGTGSQDTSGFQAAVTGSARELGENLQAKRLGLQQNAIQQLLGLSGDLLRTPLSESFIMPKKKKKSFWNTLIGAGAPIVGGALGGLYGGPAGASLGATLGGQFGSSFLE